MEDGSVVVDLPNLGAQHVFIVTVLCFHCPAYLGGDLLQHHWGWLQASLPPEPSCWLYFCYMQFVHLFNDFLYSDFKAPVLRIRLFRGCFLPQFAQSALISKSSFLLLHSLFFFCLFFVFRDRVSLNSPGCPGTHFVDQAGLELRNPPVSEILFIQRDRFN